MKTKDGREITLQRLTDVEGDKNRGWQVDRVQASVDGQEAGYLNLSYIPRARFDAHYPAGILSYLDLIKGHSLFRSMPGHQEGPEHNKPEALGDEDLRHLVRNGSWSFMQRDLSTNGELGSMNREALLKAVTDLSKLMSKRGGKDFEAFKAHFIDKPMVDFIRVEEGLQRQGIARAMYAEGAKWMASKGMRLYASGLQQHEAAMAWEAMACWTSLDGDRRYLDVAKMVIDQSSKPAKARRQAIA